jgi:hypothetical protein
MAKILDREATIKTAVVEVKALTVSGKQVTLALFRQLEEKALIDPATGDFKGIPWGWVNYHFDRCHEDGDHRHVVWQEGENLRRNQVNEKGGRLLEEHWEKMGQRSENSAWLYQAIRQKPSVRPEARLQGRPLDSYQVSDSSYTLYEAVVPGEAMAVSLPGSILRPLLYWWEIKEQGGEEAQVKQAYKTFLTATWRSPLVWKAWESVEADHALADAEANRAKGTYLRQRWDEQYESLKDLNHLFIAL